MRSKDWIAPLTGVVFVALAAVAVALFGEGQDPAKKSAQEIVDFYTDNHDEQIVGSALAGLAAVFLLFFGGCLRRVLARAEGPDGTLSMAVFGGAVVLSVGFAIGGTIHVALADLADDLDPVAVQAINGIDYYLWFPFVVGAGVMLLGSGISVLRHGALPSWLGWAAIVVGIAAFTPAGPIALLVGLAWILVVSVILMLRSGSGGSPSPVAPGP